MAAANDRDVDETDGVPMEQLEEKLVILDKGDADPKLRNLRGKLEASLAAIKGGSTQLISRVAGSTTGRAKLTEILGLRDSPFSERIIDFFFSGGTFNVDMAMDWLELLVKRGNYEHKAHFLFFMYDVQGKGRLNRADIQGILDQTIKENKFKFKADSLTILTDALFEQFEMYLEDGCLTEVGFTDFCLEYRGMLDTLAVGVLQIDSWKEDMLMSEELGGLGRETEAISAFLGKKVHRDRRQMPWGHRLRYKWKLEGWKYVMLAVWVGLMAFLFINDYMANDLEKFHRISGKAVPVAKGCASVIRLNSHLLILPMCRHFITLLRSAFLSCGVLTRLLPTSDYSRPHGPTWLWDKHVSFHKRVACTIIVFAFIHTVCHVVNAIQMTQASDKDFLNPELNWCCQPGSYLRTHPYLTSHPSFAHIVFLSAPGWTGILLLVVLALMAVTSLRRNKASNYERFWYTHHLMIFYYGLNMYHGWTGLVGPPAFWKWSAAVLSLYVLDRVCRWARYCEVTVMSAKVDPQTKWLALQLKPDKPWKFHTGAFAFLCVPSISPFQYHPFTISSTSSSQYVGFHIKADGDWTQALHDHMQVGESTGRYPRMVLQGPYSSAAEHVFEYDVCMLFCAGIGVTPYASILHSIKAKQEVCGFVGDAIDSRPPPNIHFYWMCRDQFSFSWFGGLFGELLKVKPKETFQPMRDLSHTPFVTDRFRLNLFMTGALPQTDLTNTLLGMALDSVYRRTDMDLVTGIKRSGQTSFGRPNMEAVFEEMISTYPGKEIGVFVCGPQPFCRNVHSYVMNKTGKRGTVFRYYKEVFS